MYTITRKGRRMEEHVTSKKFDPAEFSACTIHRYISHGYDMSTDLYMYICLYG